MRQDDPTRDRFAFRKLGHWNIVKKDLIPLLLSDLPVESKISSLIGMIARAHNSVELLVPLTWPAEKESKDFVGQLECLREYKEAFLQPGVVNKIMALLFYLLGINPMYFTF